MSASESFDEQVIARVRAWLARNVPRLEELDDATLTITIKDTGHRSSTGDGAILASANFHESLDTEGLMGRVERAPEEVDR